MTHIKFYGKSGMTIDGSLGFTIKNVGDDDLYDVQVFDEHGVEHKVDRSMLSHEHGNRDTFVSAPDASGKFRVAFRVASPEAEKQVETIQVR